MTPLETQINATTYADLFERMESPARDAILSQPRAIEELRQLVADESITASARFLAAELLYYAGAADTSDAATRRVLSTVYSSALAASEDGGAWGIPGRWTHPATDHAIALGDPAVPAFAPLLSNDKHLRYTGSKRAMLGDYLGMRVKDVAAFIIASVVGEPYAAGDSPSERDAFIAALAARVER